MSTHFCGRTGTNTFARDITSLINRAFYLGLTATPYVVTTWAGPAIANSLLAVSKTNWRWGYGAFAITTPVVCIPLLYLLFKSQLKAKRDYANEPSQAPTSVERSSNRISWFWEFDIIGLLLSCAGFALTLLAVQLAKYNGSTWRSTHIIVMLVLGPILIIAFVAWEASIFNPKPFLPVYLIGDRTILGACLAGTAMRIAY